MNWIAINKTKEVKSLKCCKRKYLHYTEIVILTWFFCLFSTGFNQVICSASFSFNLKEDEAWSIIVKQLSSHKSLQLGFSFKCWRMRDFLSVWRCSLILVGKWRLVSPMQQDWHPAQVNLYTKKDFRAIGKQSFEENRCCNLNGQKTILTLVFFLVQNVLHNS